MSAPPTLIVRHPKENPKKCSILPLKGMPGCLIKGYPLREMPDLANYVRLCDEGPELGPGDRDQGILLLDGSWRWAADMTRDFAHVPPRSLRGWATAYPRVSKLGSDPDNGLASIEALYLALRIVGRSTDGVLDHYHWRDAFLAANAERLATL